jgi:PII-like signaling protein
MPMELLERGHILKIYVGEADRHAGKLLYEWIVIQARASGMAGATVLRGVMGFGPGSRVFTHKIERLSQDLPVVIELVDTLNRLEAFLEQVEPAIGQGMATIETVDVRLYRHTPPAGKLG